MKQFLVILNPKSGGSTGERALADLRHRAEQEGVELEVLSTKAAGDAAEFARTSALEKQDAIISIGGDGTLNEVVNGLLTREDDRRVPVGILPMGTGNSLMTDLGCQRVDQAIEDLFSGKRFAMDVFEVILDGDPQYGFNMVGCGMPSAVNKFAEASRLFKSQRYNVGVLKAFFRYTPIGYSLRMDGLDEAIESDFILISNTRHIGNGIQVAPNAELNDGLLDAVYLDPIPKRAMIPMFLKLMKGNHLSDPRVHSRRTASFSIRAPSPQEVNLDGEQLEFTELSVSVLPQRLELLHSPKQESRS